MTGPDFSRLGERHTLGEDAVPTVVTELADGVTIELVWRNDLGGLTFRLGNRYVKYNPRTTGLDLDRERVRLDWIAEHLDHVWG